MPRCSFHSARHRLLARRTARIIFLLTLLFVLCGSISRAQEVKNGLNIGFPENGVFTGSNFDNVQLNNGNLHIEIPLWSTPGRGLSVAYKLVYDNKGWYLKNRCSHPGSCSDIVSQETGNNMHWRLAGPFGYAITHKFATQTCDTISFLTYTNYVLREPDGTKHHFLPDPAKPAGSTASCWGTLGTMYADDGSGWILHMDPNNEIPLNAVRKDGTVVNLSYDPNNQWTADGILVQDSNGNQLIYPGDNATGTGTDTLGRTLFNNEIKYYDSSGTLQTIQITYTNVSIQTSLCWLSSADICTEYSGTWSMPYQIILPNGMTYTFTYAQGAYGEPTSVTLPTGGQISWAWGSPTEDGGGRVVASRTVTVGGQTSTWTYTHTQLWQTQYSTNVRDPVGNEAKHSFTRLGSGFRDWNKPTDVPNVTKVEFFQGSAATGQLMKTVQTDYSGAGTILPIRETTTWNPTNQVSKVETDWDSFTTWSGPVTWRNPVERREYAYGTGLPGALVRKTTYNYLHLTNTTYRDPNIADRVTSQAIYDGAGVVKAQTTTSYDGGTPLAASGAPNHDYTNFGTGYLTRGNATLVQRWQNTDGAWLNTTNVYDEVGNLRSSTDPGGHTTTYSYVDDWANAYCVPAGVTTFGYVTQSTNPLGHRVKKRYFPCTGLTQQTQDENDILAGRSGTTQTYDFMNRPVQTDFPDGGQTLYAYNTPPIWVRTKNLRVPGAYIVNYAHVDQLGRVWRTELCEDGSDACTQSIKTDTTYDALGRKATVTNPYRTPSDPTYGITSYEYDALSRVTKVIPPDGSPSTNYVSTDYFGNTTTVTDQAGKKRKSETDALGRLTRVWEPDGAGNFIYETVYQYDALDNLTQVDQKGNDANSANWRTRIFQYNSLSQLTRAVNPESQFCPVDYTYDSDGNLQTKLAPAPNQTSCSTTVTTTFGYDALHRLTGKTYSNGDPAISYSL